MCPFLYIQLIAFCEAVQRKSPVGAHIRPIPGYTPGYGHEVIFADGTFIEGSTLELSADGPLREPYVAYSQVRSLSFVLV
jgi:cystathionine beta-lyase family protein involved in aluminum resistance